MSFFKLKLIVGIIIQLFTFSSCFAAPDTSCENAKHEFKKLYIAIQSSINYEKKNAYIDNGKVKLKNHTEKEYEGKIFEDALFHEYQNSLIKVAKVYQTTKKTGNEELRSNPALVDFFKAIDTKKTFDYSKFDQVLSELKRSSTLKNTNDADKKYIINDNDIYLLKQLLIHSQDKICAIEKYNKQSKINAKLDSIKNSPMNHMLLALQKGNIDAESKLDLVNTKIVLDSAVAKQMENLRKWMKDLRTNNPNCFDILKDNSDFIQNEIQNCNYRKFVDSLILNNSDVSNLESILHFINANQKHASTSPLAETGIDNAKFETFISETFKGINNKTSCTQIGDNLKKFFINVFPFKNETFDNSKLKCKINDKEIDNASCISGIELIPDFLDRGIEILPKPGSKITSFSINGASPSCNLKFPEKIEAKKTEVGPTILLPTTHEKSDAELAKDASDDSIELANQYFKQTTPAEMNAALKTLEEQEAKKAVKTSSLQLKLETQKTEVGPIILLPSTHEKSDAQLAKDASDDSIDLANQYFKQTTPAEMNAALKTLEEQKAKNAVKTSSLNSKIESAPTTSTISPSVKKSNLVLSTFPVDSKKSKFVSSTLPDDTKKQSLLSTTFPDAKNKSAIATNTIPATSNKLTIAKSALPTETNKPTIAKSALPTETNKPTIATNTLSDDKKPSIQATNKPAPSEKIPTLIASKPASAASKPTSTSSTPTSTSSTPTSTSSTPTSAASTPASTASTPASTASTPASTASTPASTASTPASTASTPASTTSTPASTASTPVSTAGNETKLTCSKKNPSLEFDAEKIICIETEESCKKKTPTQKFDADKIECIAEVIPAADDKVKAACDKRIEVDTDEGRKLNNVSWDSVKKICVEKKSKDKKEKEDDFINGDDENEAGLKDLKVYPNKPVPGRFTPMNVPSRQIYLLPGMA